MYAPRLAQAEEVRDAPWQRRRHLQRRGAWMEQEAGLVLPPGQAGGSVAALPASSSSSSSSSRALQQAGDSSGASFCRQCERAHAACGSDPSGVSWPGHMQLSMTKRASPRAAPCVAAELILPLVPGEVVRNTMGIPVPDTSGLGQCIQ